MTDSDNIYEAYIRLLNFLNQKVSHLGVGVFLSVLYARGGIFINIYILIISTE